VLLASASRRELSALKRSRSTAPETPLTEPESVYCQNVQYGKPLGMDGLDAVVQFATTSGLLEYMPLQPPVQEFHQLGLV
jgi:hypothetical protein